MAGLDEIVSMTAVTNERSRAVMERLGMSREAANDFQHPLLPEGAPAASTCPAPDQSRTMASDNQRRESPVADRRILAVVDQARQLIAQQPRHSFVALSVARADRVSDRRMRIWRRMLALTLAAHGLVLTCAVERLKPD